MREAMNTATKVDWCPHSRCMEWYFVSCALSSSRGMFLWSIFTSQQGALEWTTPLARLSLRVYASNFLTACLSGNVLSLSLSPVRNRSAFLSCDLWRRGLVTLPVVWQICQICLFHYRDLLMQIKVTQCVPMQLQTCTGYSMLLEEKAVLNVYWQIFRQFYSVALVIKIQYKHKADSLQVICLVFVFYFVRKGCRIKPSENLPITSLCSI